MGAMDWIGETIETYRWSYLLAPALPIVVAGWPTLVSPHLFFCLAVLVYIGSVALTLPLLWPIRRWHLEGPMSFMLVATVPTSVAAYLLHGLYWQASPGAAVVCQGYTAAVALGGLGGLVFWLAAPPAAVARPIGDSAARRGRLAAGALGAAMSLAVIELRWARRPHGSHRNPWGLRRSVAPWTVGAQPLTVAARDQPQ